jgi:hypothetical protein
LDLETDLDDEGEEIQAASSMKRSRLRQWAKAGQKLTSRGDKPVKKLSARAIEKIEACLEQHASGSATKGRPRLGKVQAAVVKAAKKVAKVAKKIDSVKQDTSVCRAVLSGTPPARAEGQSTTERIGQLRLSVRALHNEIQGVRAEDRERKETQKTQKEAAKAARRAQREEREASKAARPAKAAAKKSNAAAVVQVQAQMRQPSSGEALATSSASGSAAAHGAPSSVGIAQALAHAPLLCGAPGLKGPCRRHVKIAGGKCSGHRVAG